MAIVVKIQVAKRSGYFSDNNLQILSNDMEMNDLMSFHILPRGYSSKEFLRRDRTNTLPR
ncbi:MAG: hypothetical protein HC866_21630 [Leptolyngbyaceae cyanobacterium RU_5_1]|nr:hypothetical protein [Leptolyngbyaceae cyanobacterium RU_5_1]